MNLQTLALGTMALGSASILFNQVRRRHSKFAKRFLSKGYVATYAALLFPILMILIASGTKPAGFEFRMVTAIALIMPHLIDYVFTKKVGKRVQYVVNKITVYKVYVGVLLVVFNIISLGFTPEELIMTIIILGCTFGDFQTFFNKSN